MIATAIPSKPLITVSSGVLHQHLGIPSGSKIPLGALMRAKRLVRPPKRNQAFLSPKTKV